MQHKNRFSGLQLGQWLQHLSPGHCVCVCVCIVNVIVKRLVLPPCVVDGRSRSRIVKILIDDDELMLNVLRCHLTY